MTVSTPDFRVLVNGTEIVGVDYVQATIPGAFQASRFTVRKAVSATDIQPPSWWDALTHMRVDITATTDGAGWFPLITGDVDDWEYDPIEGTIELVGRDLAALLIDNRTTQVFRNLTASEIAQKLAEQHGLSAQVTPTHTTMGRYYRQQYNTLFGSDNTHAINDWDLICQIGQIEGIVPYVQGTTLYFERPAASPPAVRVHYDQGVSNVTGLRFGRSLTLAKDVHVTVRSWDAWTSKTITGEAVVKAAKVAGDDAGRQVDYYFSVPNLTHAQANATAQRLAVEISKHERRIDVSMPAYLGITPAYVVAVTGLGGSFDLSYYPETITTTISANGGAVTEIEAKNHPPIALYDGASGAQLAIPQ